MAIAESKKRAGAASGEEERLKSRALAKGLEMLERLAQCSHPLGLAELAHMVGLGKPSAFRLLQTLVATGYVRQREDSVYELNRVWVPALTQDWQLRLVSAARPEMEALGMELAETVTLAVLMVDHIRVVETRESSQHIRMSNYPNRILPPYASSLGKAIAAFQPPERLQQLFQVYGIYATTENTITDPAAIRQELAGVRERGFSREFEETVKGGCCFAAPIAEKNGAVEAAISVSLPTARLTPALEKRIPSLVMATAHRIEKRMRQSLKE